MTSSTPTTLGVASPSVVLLVEDNAIIAMNTEALLLDLGIADVRIAATVAEALALIDTMQFDLGILDLKLGDGEDSLPVAERLVADGVAIVFASGFGEEAGLTASFGTVPMLKKPYGFDDLERIIRPA
ncbi:MAG: response regulator [Sphingomonas sp.]|nr:response regulator [Sphingomonas sp.]